MTSLPAHATVSADLLTFAPPPTMTVPTALVPAPAPAAAANSVLQLETHAQQIRELEQARDALTRDKTALAQQLTDAQQRHAQDKKSLTETAQREKTLQQREEKLQQQLREATDREKQCQQQLREGVATAEREKQLQQQVRDAAEREKQLQQQVRDATEREKQSKQHLRDSGEREKQVQTQLRESTERLQKILSDLQALIQEKKTADQTYRNQVQQLEDKHKSALNKTEQSYKSALKDLQGKYNDLNLKYQDLGGKHHELQTKCQSSVNEFQRLQQALRQTEQKFAQQEVLCVAEQKKIKQELADLEDRKRQSDTRCKDMEKRVLQHIDDRLSSTTRDQFNSLNDFPHNQNIAQHYHTVMNELRMEALEWIETEFDDLHSNDVLTCLEFTIQVCLGWVLNHKLPQYDEWVMMVFAPTLESDGAVKSGAGGKAVKDKDKDKDRDGSSAEGQPSEYKQVEGDVSSFTTSGAGEASRTRSVSGILMKCKHAYSTGQKLVSAPIPPLRQWLYVLLRTLHKSHNNAKRMSMEGKQIWQAVCESHLGKLIPWGKPIASYITGRAFNTVSWVCVLFSPSPTFALFYTTELLSVCWEIVLATPTLDLMITQHNAAHYSVLGTPSTDKRDTIKLGFPVLAVAENREVLVKGEVFFVPQITTPGS